MFELRIKVDFPAGHHLVGYPGDCARPHGHNWELEVFARSRTLDQVGMALDFRNLKKTAKELVAAWDHQDLNTLPEFASTNPTAENIAKLAYERLSKILNGRETWISRVTVWENARSSASYFEEAAPGAER